MMTKGVANALLHRSTSSFLLVCLFLKKKKKKEEIFLNPNHATLIQKKLQLNKMSRKKIKFIVF